MSNTQKDITVLSAEQKRALIAELLQKKARQPQLFPLSFAQQRLWFLNQLDPGSPLYNISCAVRLMGALNVAALQQTLNEIVRRHEVLRTSFKTVEEEQPVQAIVPNLTLTLPLINLQELLENQREKEMLRIVNQEAQQPFNLTQAPLLRTTLLRLDELEHVVMFTIHHIVSDGWSKGILIKEVATLYEAFIKEQPSPLPELSIQYVDFAAWQRQWLQGEVFKSQTFYWRLQLENAPRILELPTDLPRKSLQLFQGATYSFKLSAELSLALNKLSQQQGSTLFMTLLAAFQTLLWHYTGSEDIVVGSPIANRNRPEIEGLIGFFVNILVLRTNLGGNPTFVELLTRVREMTLGAYAHQDLPFEQLVEELQPQRDLSYTPLFQVVFALQNAPMSALELPGLTLSLLETESRTAKFDLSLYMTETPQGLVGSLEYNTDLFESSTISRIAGHLQTLLYGIVANPQQRLSELPLLTLAEKALFAEWNDTEIEYPQNQYIHQLFEAQVESNSDAVAVVFELEQLTYCELNARANKLAHYLRSLGVKPEVLVGIYIERSLDLVIGLLGILKAGGAYVPLDTTYPKERLAYMLSNVQMPVLLTQEQLVAKLPDYTAQIVCLDSNWDVIEQAQESNLSNEVKGENLAYVIYTSGSIGKPKSVAIEHRQILNYLESALKRFNFSTGSSFATVSTLAADLGNTVIFPSLCTGGQLHVLSWERVSTPDAFTNYLLNNSIDYLKIVPSHLAALQNSAEFRPVLPRKGLILGGETSRLDWVKSLLAIDQQCTIFNHYGPTETTVGVLTYCVEREKPLSKTQTLLLGRPLGNIQIYLLDTQLNPVPIGVSGEIYICGAGVARSYLNLPDLTAAKFIPNPFSNKVGERLYKTGDLARYLPDGNIEFIGRVDDQVKVRGFRVELKEIETILCQHPDVREAKVIFWKEEPDNNGRLVAYLVPSLERSPTISGLPRYKLPNNLAVAHLNKNETDYIYKEIFELQAYLKHGVTIQDGDCIIDVGANIGLFTLFVHQICKHPKVYAFEPNPIVFKILQANASLYGTDTNLFNYGLSDKQKTATFTYFPGFSLLSGFYADVKTEREVVKNFMRNQQNEGMVEMTDLISQADEILEERLKAESFTSDLITLSDFIEEQKIERIDLLKINVEKSEFDVLAGIKEKDWKKIRQIVLEVDTQENLEPILSLLKQQGYEFVMEQDVLLANTQLCYIYAIRLSTQEVLIPGQKSGTHIHSLPILDNPLLSSNELRYFLRKQLPDYMIPSDFLLLEVLPLLPNGKVDRQALLASKSLHSELGVTHVKPRTEVEQTLAKIWQEVLHVEKVSIYDNFFDIGGHSLLLAQVYSKLKKILQQDLSMVKLFQYPTISDLAKYLSQGQSKQSNLHKHSHLSENFRNSTDWQKQLRKKHRSIKSKEN